MLYSDLFIKREKKVSTLFLAPLLVMIIVVNFFLNKTKTALPSRALSNFPKQVKTLKLTENQVIVFWETNEKEVSYLLFGESVNKIHQIVLDDRDTQSFKTKRFFHLVTFNNLKPDHEYFFRIVAEKKIYDDLNGKPFSFKNELKKQEIFASPPLYGKVVDKAGRGLSEAILIFNVDNQPLGITYSKADGNWLVVLRRLEKSLIANDVITIDVYSEDKKRSHIKGTIKDLSPLATAIVIGKDYELSTNQDDVLSSMVSREKKEVFQILYPKDKATIPGFRPLIKGLGFLGKEVDVVLRSKSIYSFKTKVDKDGYWQVNLNFDLLPGDYFLEVKSTDYTGNSINKSLTFKIIKSGEQVLGEATPSATLIPSPTLVSSPTLIFSPPTKPSLSPSSNIYNTGQMSSFLFGTMAFIFLIAGVFLMLVY